MRIKTVEVQGFTRPDMVKMARKFIRTGEIPNTFRLKLGVRITPPSIIDSGREGDPMNAAPPVHCVPEMLSTIRSEGFRDVVVFDSRRARPELVGAYLQTALWWGMQGGMNELQFMVTPSQKRDVEEIAPHIRMMYPRLSVGLCQPESETHIFTKAIDPMRTTGSICLVRLGRILRYQASA